MDAHALGVSVSEFDTEAPSEPIGEQPEEKPAPKKPKGKGKK